MPNHPTEIKSLARSYANLAIRTLGGLAKDAKSEKARIAASQILLDRGYGKPKQTVEHTGEDGGAITVRVVYGEDD